MISFPFSIVLGSKSPRRRELLAAIVDQFDVQSIDVEEIYPKGMNVRQIPEYLAQLKAASCQVSANQVLITADTLVVLDNEVLGKPVSFEHARQMLRRLSGKKHEVITGVCLKTNHAEHVFSETTYVEFNMLSDEEIDHYVKVYKPLDKAGAYGIQEWIGSIGVKRIEGSYLNVVGLPVQRLYSELKQIRTL